MSTGQFSFKTPRIVFGSLVTSFATLAMLTTPLVASAEERAIDWVGSVSLGLKGFEFDEDRSGTIISSLNANTVGATFNNSQKYDEGLPFVGLGFGAAFDRYYIAVGIEVPVGEVSFDQDFTGNTGITRGLNGDLTRSDYSITVGASVWEGLSLFAGFKAGKTELDYDEGFSDNAPTNYETEYEEDGFFIGADYSIDIAETGTLTFSFAYADFDAEYSESGNFGVPNSPTNLTPVLVDEVTYDGDADGFSYGVRWTAELAESLQYNVALRYQRYELDGDGGRRSFTNTNVTGLPAVEFNQIALDLETTQTITTISAGISYVF